MVWWTPASNFKDYMADLFHPHPHPLPITSASHLHWSFWSKSKTSYNFHKYVSVCDLLKYKGSIFKEQDPSAIIISKNILMKVPKIIMSGQLSNFPYGLKYFILGYICLEVFFSIHRVSLLVFFLCIYLSKKSQRYICCCLYRHSFV